MLIRWNRQRLQVLNCQRPFLVGYNIPPSTNLIGSKINLCIWIYQKKGVKTEKRVEYGKKRKFVIRV